jgi:hypothetical protein
MMLKIMLVIVIIRVQVKYVVVVIVVVIVSHFLCFEKNERREAVATMLAKSPNKFNVDDVVAWLFSVGLQQVKQYTTFVHISHTIE